MTDTDTTTEQTETTFGINTTEILDRYHKDIDKAEQIYSTAVDAANSLLYTAHSAVLELLDGIPVARDITALLTTLSQDKRDQLTAVARDARDRLVQHAEDEKTKALEVDPFTSYVVSTLSHEVTSSYTTTLLSNAPFTFASLRQLANDKEWCSDFEYFARLATEAGALPRETRTVTREIPGPYVPAEHNAKEGEAWLAHLVLPSYHRDKRCNGRPSDFLDLERYAESVTYEKKPVVPKQRSDADA